MAKSFLSLRGPGWDCRGLCTQATPNTAALLRIPPARKQILGQTWAQTNTEESRSLEICELPALLRFPQEHTSSWRSWWLYKHILILLAMLIYLRVCSSTNYARRWGSQSRLWLELRYLAPTRWVTMSERQPLSWEQTFNEAHIPYSQLDF